MTHRQADGDHLEWLSMRKLLATSTVTAMFIALFATAAMAEVHSTGLERAAEATLQGLEMSQGKSADAPGQVNRAKGLNNQGDKLTGRARAFAAITAALERGNGNGNAYGRGHAIYVLQILIDGGIPGELKTENHGQAVRDMVHAFNELRKSQESS